MRGELDLAIAGRFADRIAQHADIFIGGERASLPGFIRRKARGELKSPAKRLNIGDLDGHALLDAGNIGVRNSAQSSTNRSTTLPAAAFRKRRNANSPATPSAPNR